MNKDNPNCACGVELVEGENWKPYAAKERWYKCDGCRSEYNKQYVKANSHRHRRLAYLRRYNLTMPEYEALLIKQEGKCAICGCVPNEPLHVDHSHDTGKVRGLLCGNCNRGIRYLLLGGV